VKDTGDGAGRPLRILLVGERKSGKTTCCLHTAALLREQKVRPGGVVCPKLFDETGRVTGIEVLDMLRDPPSREILARTDRRLDGPSTGAYHFSPRALAFGRAALESGFRQGDVVFADELGPLEMRGEGFSNLLDLARTPSAPPMVIVVRTELLSHVRRELEPIPVTVVDINPSNRDKTPSHLLDLLRDSI
jgi:nucleoside-triphosphatase THEP1